MTRAGHFALQRRRIGGRFQTLGGVFGGVHGRRFRGRDAVDVVEAHAPLGTIVSRGSVLGLGIGFAFAAFGFEGALGGGDEISSDDLWTAEGGVAGGYGGVVFGWCGWLWLRWWIGWRGSGGRWLRWWRGDYGR